MMSSGFFSLMLLHVVKLLLSSINVTDKILRL